MQVTTQVSSQTTALGTNIVCRYTGQTGVILSFPTQTSALIDWDVAPNRQPAYSTRPISDLRPA